ncbi:hypothetical protein MSG28_011270 [Choristoneura fumiferana]|uniref:Uncharacterized protein n=2 Tax=Choristoneura fumiferana TaxID=7141 RepID=A0ACC0KRQ2_CHOFU|nr:hypothetical protein MSG28_011270 [Choristoneura fumiferana]
MASQDATSSQQSEVFVVIKSEDSENTCENSAFKESFDIQLANFYNEQIGTVKKPWTSDRVLEVIRDMKAAKAALDSGVRRTSSQYYLCAKYDLIHVGNDDYLIFKKKAPEEPTVHIIPVEQYFDLLFQIHEEIGHGGRDKMIQSLKNRFYIHRKAIELFVFLCPTCEMKRKLPRKGLITTPKGEEIQKRRKIDENDEEEKEKIEEGVKVQGNVEADEKEELSKDFNYRAQVDVIDLQSIPDGDFKWLLNYKDHGTQFVQLRPLQTNQATDVALELVKIFLSFGAPFVLQSTNGREFTAKVIEEVMNIWPDCKIVLGNPRHPQTLGTVERTNEDVENMLHTWMHDNNSTNWSIGCLFVQFQKNASFNETVGRTPYHTLFGCDPTSGLQSSKIPGNILKSIETEEDLKQISQVYAKIARLK